MSYKLEWKASPNYTPGSQTQAFYGQPRSIKFGAGHWWNTPEAGATHDGVVNIFLNPARQGSAHAVLSDGRVTEMVRATDTAWTTNNANPYTYSIETDPRIMWKWTSSGANKALGERIFNTLCEYIADKGFHNLTWYPHNHWWQTQCNPIRWNEVMAGAKAVWQQKYGTPAPTWRPMDTPRHLLAKEDLRVINLSTNQPVGNAIKKGTDIDFREKKEQNGQLYLRSKYSTDAGLNYGIDYRSLEELPAPVPEWQKNLKDITAVKLMVLSATAPIYNLNDTRLQVGSPIPQGTWIDFTKQTTVGGKVYLISSYSATNAMPNGILKTDVGIPATNPGTTPTPEPEWLKNWQDIADVTMYARADIEVVNLLDGSTVTTIAKGTAVEIASATEWHGQKYLITKYSTEKKAAAGIRVVDLSANPVEDTSEPIPEDPDQPVDDLIKENNSLLKQILALLQKIWDKITGK